MNSILIEQQQDEQNICPSVPSHMSWVRGVAVLIYRLQNIDQAILTSISQSFAPSIWGFFMSEGPMRALARLVCFHPPRGCMPISDPVRLKLQNSRRCHLYPKELRDAVAPRGRNRGQIETQFQFVITRANSQFPSVGLQ